METSKRMDLQRIQKNIVHLLEGYRSLNKVNIQYYGQDEMTML